MRDNFNTADLCDAAEESGTAINVAAPIFFNFGGAARFAGKIETIHCRDDNSLVRAALSENGAGKVLVVDNGGSMKCAVLGGNLAAAGMKNGWAGAIVNGCVRDSAELRDIAFGVLALAKHPRRSVKRGEGERGKPANFAGVDFTPGHFVCADADGVVVGAKALV